MPPSGSSKAAAPCDHLAFVERQRRDAVDRCPHLAREGRIVGGGVGLPVMFGGGDDDAIDERARDLYVPWVQGPRRRNPFYLHDD